MNKTTATIFSNIYKTSQWISNCETRDGIGSSNHYTQTIRKHLPDFLKKWKINSMLDASCGEFNWMKDVDLSGIKYIGADIVTEKIDLLKNKYPDKEWMALDIIEDELPKADLWICRDTLFHFPHSFVKKTLINFLNSEITYILVSSHPDATNIDIANFGEFNIMNLEKPPFSFPTPLDRIDDTGPEFHIRRELLLYSKNDMKNFYYLK